MGRTRRSYLKVIGVTGALTFGSGVAGAMTSPTEYVSVPHGKKVREENVIVHDGTQKFLTYTSSLRTRSERTTPAAETGSYTDRWTYSAWWGPDSSGAYHHGPVKAADPGDTLFGYMNVDNSNGGQWYIEMQNLTRGTSSSVYSDYLSLDFTHAFTTLEVAGYNWGRCDQLPGYTTFYQQNFENFAGQGVAVDWQGIVNSNAQCDVSTTASSSSKTTIHTPN